MPALLPDGDHQQPVSPVCLPLMAGKWPSHRVAPEKPQSGGGTGIQGGAESLARGPVGTAGQGGAWPLQLVKTGPKSGFGTVNAPRGPARLQIARACAPPPLDWGAPGPTLSADMGSFAPKAEAKDSWSQCSLSSKRQDPFLWETCC